MTTIKELKAELAVLTEKVNAFETKQDLPDILWKPKKGERYWFVASKGHKAIGATWFNDKIDNPRWDMGNVFRTEEDAKYALAKMKAETKFKRLAAQAWVDAGEALDWGDADKWKWWVYWSSKVNCLSVDCTVTHFQGATHFPSEQAAQAAVEDMGDDMEYLKDE